MRRFAWILPAALLVIVCPLAAQDTFNGCGMEGNPKKKSLKAVNRDKNRFTPPEAADIDAAVTLAKMLKIGDDIDRWDEDKGAEIVGYVFNVKPGGIETCNCKATEAEFKDTHIEIVPAVNKNDPTHRVIVERLRRACAPRWRSRGWTGPPRL